MDDNRVPYIVHEGIVARLERIIKRLTIFLIITTAMLFATNLMWQRMWMQYDYTDDSYESVELKGNTGDQNYIGGRGIINYGHNQSSEIQTES